jgi:hypothetical protein
MFSRAVLGLSLLALLAALYELGGQWRLPPLALPAPAVADAPPPVQRAADSVGRIVAAHAFGRSPAAPTGAGVARRNTGVSKVRLLGVMAEAGGRGAAVLARGGRAAAGVRYSVGEAVPDVGELQAVWPDHVVLLAGDGLRTLYLIGAKKTGARAAGRVQASAQSRPKSASSRLAGRNADPVEPD